MDNAWDYYRKLLDKGFIIYQKNGIIESVERPDYGSITLNFQSGKIVTQEVKKITK